MGFLDRMVSDLIYKNTGFKARRLVRKVGGGKLLLAGAGAVIAAALSEQQGAQTQQPPSSPGAAPPPPPGSAPSSLPPLPTAAAAPPPPPLPMEPAAPATAAPFPADAAMPPADSAMPPADTVEQDEDPPPEDAYAIIRTLVAAAMADGRLSGDEKEVIDRHLGESNLSAEERAQIHRDMALPPTPAELAAQATDPELRQTLYRFAALVIHADRHVSELEKSWLLRLAGALDISEARRQELEGEVFAA